MTIHVLVMTIRVLHTGLALCGLGDPENWPLGDTWVTAEEANKSTCGACRQEAVSQFKVMVRREEAGRSTKFYPEMRIDKLREENVGLKREVELAHEQLDMLDVPRKFGFLDQTSLADRLQLLRCLPIKQKTRG